MRAFDLPYTPIRNGTYTPAELFGDFDPAVAGSWTRTKDFLVYQHYVATGGSAPLNPYLGMMQALHDHSMTQALGGVLAGKRVVAVMGGHKMRRDSAAYASVAALGRRLTRSGLLVCSGGGPGAMEATHLGAALAFEAIDTLEAAVAALAREPEVPALAGIVASDGTVDAALAAKAHAWFKPAFDVAWSVPRPGTSVAVPTWHYGHEPTTPLATHHAKYFQNSIREDGLLAVAKQGVVYAEGKAGTIQEIFQDGAQNYYQTFGHWSPMVLLGTEYWETKFPVVPVLKALFGAADFARYVLVTDDIDAAATFLEQFTP